MPRFWPGRGTLRRWRGRSRRRARPLGDDHRCDGARRTPAGLDRCAAV